VASNPYPLPFEAAPSVSSMKARNFGVYCSR